MAVTPEEMQKLNELNERMRAFLVAEIPDVEGRVGWLIGAVIEEFFSLGALEQDVAALASAMLSLARATILQNCVVEAQSHSTH